MLTSCKEKGSAVDPRLGCGRLLIEGHGVGMGNAHASLKSGDVDDRQ